METKKTALSTRATSGSLANHDSVVSETLNRWAEQIPKNTVRAYRVDVEQFIFYCDGLGLSMKDFQPVEARSYIAYLSEQYKPNTIIRKVAAIRSQLDLFLEGSGADLSNPFRSQLVKDAIKSMKKDKALQGEKVSKAKGIKYEDIITVFRCLEKSPKAIDHRDRVLLIVAFLGGFRRSELAALKWSDVERTDQGLKVHIRTSKSNQDGSGEEFKLFFHGGILSVPALLEIWQHIQFSKSEYVFPVINRWGQITEKPIDGKTVNRILKKHFGESVSGHSTRRGFINDAFERGASLLDIANQTGQAPATIQKHYLNELDKTKHNAARLF